LDEKKPLRERDLRASGMGGRTSIEIRARDPIRVLDQVNTGRRPGWPIAHTLAVPSPAYAGIAAPVS
jgi:hypothetical protein